MKNKVKTFVKQTLYQITKKNYIQFVLFQKKNVQYDKKFNNKIYFKNNNQFPRNIYKQKKIFKMNIQEFIY